MSKLLFGDIVVVDGNQIGVVVKSWGASLKGRPPHYEVYVRSVKNISNATGVIGYFWCPNCDPEPKDYKVPQDSTLKLAQNYKDPSGGTE